MDVGADVEVEDAPWWEDVEDVPWEEDVEGLQSGVDEQHGAQW